MKAHAVGSSLLCRPGSSVQHQDLLKESQSGLADGVVGRQFGLSDRKLYEIPAGDKTESCLTGYPRHI